MRCHVRFGIPFQAAVDELRRRHIVLPPATIERLCAEVSTRAQRQVYRLLTDPLSQHNAKRSIVSYRFAKVAASAR
jgi:hypothetical protein